MTTHDDVAGFLSRHAPFRSLTSDELGELAANSTVLEMPTGRIVVDSTAPATDEIWAVYRGQVQLFAVTEDDPAAEPIDVINPGGIFGVSSLLTGESVQFTARTNGSSVLIRLPGNLVRPVFNRPDGVSYLAEMASVQFAHPRSDIEQAFARRPVGELLHSDPVLVSTETSVRDAVRHMTSMRSSYVLIPLGNSEYGIFTDRDLRTRVVAVDVSVDSPIRTVMSAPARVVSEDRLASTVLIEMLEHGLRHMPVLNGRRQVLGVLDDTDLLAASTRRSFVLRRSVALSVTSDELVRAAAGITDLVVDLIRGGTDVIAASGILSVVIDSVVRRALELTLSEGVDLPEAKFAWITMGSIARREAMPSSDVDTALSWADDGAQETDRFLHLAARVHEILDACGLPADRNGALASSKRFARSRTQWLQASQEWMQEPLKDQGLIMSSLLVDGRVIWGESSLHTVPLGYHRMRDDHPEALRLQLLDALSGRVRHRSFRDILSRRSGTFDLKAHALTPVVNLARWGGLSVGVASASTPARLGAAAGNDLLTQDDATVLDEVFVLLQRIRMTHQIEQIMGGRTPGDVVSLAELTPLNKKMLADGVREVAAVQKRITSRLSSATR